MIHQPNLMTKRAGFKPLYKECLRKVGLFLCLFIFFLLGYIPNSFAEEVCISETADTFYVNSIAGVDSFVWTVPAGAAIVSGQGDTMIVVDWSSATSGTDSICVYPVDSCGPGNTTCTAVNIKEVILSNTFVNISCSGGNDGSIDLTVSSGTAPYTYNWSSGQTIQDISGLTAGIYTVTVTDANGCFSTSSATLTEPPLLTAVSSKSDIDCNGANNGAIDLTVAGGTPPYSFNWSGSDTTEDLSGLAQGAYSVTVTDANGCTASSNQTITQPAALSASTSQVNVSCNGTYDGSINLSVSGGSAPYSYNWSNTDTTEDISGLTVGTYDVTVTDANGCTTTSGATITQPDSLLASNTHIDVTCSGNSDGSIDVTVTGGTTPYSYSWSHGPASQDVSSLPAGTYTVTITDALGCTVTTDTTIYAPDSLTASVFKIDVLCNGGNNGSIDLTVSDGTPPYTYNWSNGETTEDIDTLTAGIYSVTITDGNGCTILSGATITEPAVLSASTSQVNVGCSGSNDGSINLTVSGGTAPYTYTWSTTDTSEDIDSLIVGTYNVTVTDVNGCTTTTGTTITQPDSLTASNTQVNVSCNGGNNGSIDVTVSNGTAPYTYVWSHGPTTQDVSGLSAGSYEVTVTDASGCTVLTGATITEPDTLTASTTQVNISCNGLSDGAIDLTINGGTSPYTFNWSNTSTTEDINSLATNSYNVTVTDAQGCTVTTGATITEPALLTASTAQTNVTCNGGNDGSIDLTVGGGTAPYTFSWSNAETDEDIDTLNAGAYNVTVTDANGCTVSTGTTITEPSVVSVSNNVTPASCNGGSDGALDITVSGGNSPYSFVWSTGDTTEDISGLVSANYTVTVTDAQGCEQIENISVTGASALIINLDSIINVSCNGGSDGSIDIAASGGTPPYLFTWSTGSSMEDITGLAAGLYVVTVSDSNSCSTVANYNVTESTLLTASLSKVDVTCNGNDDGAINMTVSDGTPPYSFSWSNGETTEDIDTLTAGSYSVTITDALGCTMATGATISEPSVLSASASKINVSCNSGNDASINLTALGGTAPYTYIWSTGDTSQNISGLTAGTYIFTITDAAGCDHIDSVVITEPLLLTSTATPTDVSCNGGSTGSIDLMVSGGTYPYSFNWSNSDTTEDLTNLSTGNFTVTVTDVNGCKDTSSTVISQPSAMVDSLGKTDVSCNGDNDGTIDLIINGGTAPYSYNWSTGATSQDLSSLTVGSYSVTTTDAQGCFVISNITIDQPAVLSAVTGIVNVSCNGGNDGTISLTVNGGTMPYSYFWSNGETTEDLDSLTVGTYSVTVTDTNSCTVTAGRTITEPGALSLSTSTVNVSCNGGNNGIINLTVSGGTPPYSYNWSNGDSVKDISGLTVGSYTVTVTDNKGCDLTTSANINEPTAITVSSVSLDVSCNGGNNGSINLTVSGGSSPYSYNWSNGATAEDINSLTAGVYAVTITDAQSCLVILNDTVGEPAMLTASTSQVNVNCNGVNNGSIDLSISGGTTPYGFSWSNGETTEDIDSLTFGNYTVTVVDAQGCTINAGANITQPSALSVSTTQVNASCSGYNDGSIDLAVSGGVSPYTYNWSNGETTQDIDSLADGSYSVTVTDANGCTIGTGTTITVPDGLTDTVVIVNVSCNGGNDGSIDLMIYGGTSPYTYAWGHGPVTQDITGLVAGTYTVTITDALGCKLIADHTITEPALLTATTSQVNVSCNSFSDGAIDLTVAGGTAPYTFSWSNGDTTEDIDTISAGTYNVTITDAQGCSATTGATITQPSPLTTSTSQINVSCNGGNDGDINLNVGGGTAPYAYSWSNGETTQDIDTLTAGTYNVTITDAQGCTITNVATIIEPSLLTASTTHTDVSCNGGNNGFIDLSVSGGSSPYTYAWSTGATTQDAGGLTIGVYTATVTDAQGCTAVMTDTISEPAALSLSHSHDNVSCYEGEDGSINISVSGGTTPYTYFWSNGKASEDIDSLTASTYFVTVTDAQGCDIIDSLSITEPSELTASTTKIDVGCFGGNNGSADVTVTGGTLPYTFNWSNGETTEDIDSLFVGSFNVVVTDSHGCVAVAGATIAQPAALAISATIVDASCNGTNDGSIDVTVSGGTAPYSYAWSTADNMEDIDSLIIGSYSITVTDAQGCASSDTFNISQPTTLAAAATKTDVNCNGASTGSVDLTVNGGTTPYSYSWSNGETTQDIGSLPIGSYDVTVTDALGCMALASASITQPATLTTSTTKKDVNCKNGNNGFVNLTVGGGVPPYSYSWSNGDTTQDIDTLTAGNYSVTVTDSLGCQIIANETVNEPALLVATLTKVNVSCFGGNDGSADVTVVGGTTPYVYIWSNGATTQDIDSLTAGSYNLVVTDTLGCVGVVGTTITQPTNLTTSAVKVDVSCNGGNNGSINLTVSGATPPYTYNWSNGETTQDIDTLTAGSYTVTVTDAKGCIKIRNVIISEPGALTASTIKTDISCNGDDNGEIDLTVSGGTAPYSYNWSNGETSEDISNLDIGTYNVTVTDANGCSISAGETITEPAPLTASTSKENNKCNGDGTGEIDLTVGGGTTPYAYNWSNGDTTEDLTSLSAGTFNVTITDANGCSATASETVTEPAQLALTTTSSDASCNGGADGGIDLTVNGGTSPYNFTWTTGDSSEDLSGFAAGVYGVTVTDAQGCVESTTENVSEATALSISLNTKTNVSCNGGNDGAIDISILGGTAPYSYNWSNGSSAEDITGLTAGSYAVTVTDANLCSKVASYVINQPTAISASSTTTDVSCNSGINGAIDVTVSGGISPYSYLWNTGDSTEDLNGINAGTYNITITDNNGCTATINHTINEPAVLSISSTETHVQCHGENTGMINVTVNGGTFPYSYSWNNGSTTEDLNSLGAGNYNLTVTDGQGCTQTAGITISQPSAMAMGDFSTAATCGVNDGTATISVTGGTPGYTYYWTLTGDTTSSIDSVGGGLHKVIITDANGCIDSTIVVVQGYPAADVDATSTDVNCNGGADGTASANVITGTPPFQYYWTQTGDTVANISGLSTGMYTVVITDSINCIASTNVFVSQPSAFSVSMAVNDAKCYGESSGSIDLTIGGATPPFTYLWSTGDTSEDLNGIPMGSYDVTITDAQGCTVSTGANISEPTALASSTIITDALCNGDNSGAVNLSVSGGTSPYVYLWSTGATIQDISNLVIGTYIVTITDNQGCQLIDTAVVSEPSALSVTSSATNVSCNGGSSGTIDLIISGGTSPFTYNWSTGDTSQDISGLSAGSYSYTVTDGQNCMLTGSVTITEPASLSASISNSNVSCNAGSDGALDLTVAGGTMPYTFNWSTGDTTEDISGLATGNYLVTVTDSNGCTRIAGRNVTQPAPLTSNFVKTNVSCNGLADGAINVTVAGGTPSYDFIWSTGDTTEDLSGLTTGTYTVTITDQNGCSNNLSVSISQPNTLSLSAVATNSLCNGCPNGSVNLTVTGGTSPYDYLWNTGATTEDLTGITAGTYCVTVTDANGCNDNVCVNVDEPDSLNISMVVVDVSCNGGADGSINLTVSGGVAPYGFNWSTGDTTEDISGLTAGNYTVTVTNSNGYTQTASATVNEPTSLTASTIPVHLTCSGNNTGSIDLTVSGGTLPYTYVWSTGATSEDIDSLAAGSYSVTITDSQGCVITLTESVTQPNGLTITATPSHVSCNGASDGAIDITINGGTTPYAILWSTGDSTEDLSGLTAGTYNVTVTDANGCIATRSVDITEPAVLVSTFTKIDVSCNGNSNGSIDLTVTGGTSPYAYNWSTGDSTEDINGLSVGNYSVTVSDAQGCTTTSSISITEPNVLAATLTKVDVSCNGGNDGSIDLTISGGTTPYDIVWSSGDTTEDLSGLSTGSYSVTVTDDQGCTAINSINVGTPAALSLSFVTTQTNCSGSKDGAVDMTVTGGTTPYTYQWNFGATSEDIGPIGVGSYSVTVTDSQGCIITGTTNVNDPAQITIGVTNFTEPSCNGGTDGAIDLTINGGTSPFTYIWSTGDTTEDISDKPAGNYGFTVTDANGCTRSSSFNIGQPDPLTVSENITAPLCNANADGSIAITVSGGTAPYYYTWDNGAITEDISGLPAGNYSVTITDDNGCTISENYTVTDPDELSASVQVTDLDCYGDTTGNVNLSVSGGTAPYSYSWSTGDNTQDIADLGAGAYTVTITDNNGCSMTDTAVIAQPTSIQLAITKTNVQCNGNNDGSIDITVSGGTPPYRYAWSTNATTEDLSGLTPGIYSVTVIDANDCRAVKGISISQPTALGVTLSRTNAACNGSGTGAVNATINGGVAPYTYLWSRGDSTKDLENVSAGQYSITVTDANGCTAMNGIIVGEPAKLAIAYTKIDVACYNGASGSIDVTVTGGTSPYFYQWNTGPTTPDLNGLSTGTYSLTVTDINGCGAFLSVDINQPNQLTATANATNVSCNGAMDGTITLNVSGGVTPYSYSWSNGESTKDLGSLNPGTYTVTVTDANNCSITLSKSVTGNPALAITVRGISDVICNGQNSGYIDILVTGGVQPYTYNWSNNTTTEDISGLNGGSYSVTVTDAKGCTVSKNFIIGEPAALVVAMNDYSNALCNGQNSGYIDITVSGGTPAYTYQWSNGPQTEDVSGLGGGSYSVTVSDAHSCSVVKNYNLTEPPALNVTLNSIKDASCYQATDGHININVSGGTPPYTYSWNTGADTQDLMDKGQGSYSVTVTDANGCSRIKNYNIGQPSPLSISVLSLSDVKCNGATTGSINIRVNGGTSPYSFVWSNNETTEDVSALGSGSYSVTVTDAAGCVKTGNYNIGEPTAIAITASLTHVTCQGNKDGAIDIDVSGGTPPYSYTWGNGEISQDLSGLSGGHYPVTVTDAAGCIATREYDITEPAALQVGVISIRDNKCFGDSSGIIDISVTGGTSPYSYTWSNGSNDQDLTNLSGGSFSVTVEDANNCSVVKNYNIGEPKALNVSVAAVNDAQCHGDSSAIIDIEVTGGVAAYDYIWNTGDTTQDLTGIGGGSYSVIVSDMNGCSASKNYNIGEPTEIKVTGTITNNIMCYGDTLAAIDLEVTGGTPGYTYVWNDSSTTEDLNGISNGTYSVTITDDNGCQRTETYSITEPEKLRIAVLSIKDANCSGGKDGSVNIDVLGGTPPYQYVWTINDSVIANDQDLSGLSKGIYAVTATDVNGCEASTVISVGQASPLVIDFDSVQHITCNGAAEGYIEISVRGGRREYQYLWNTGDTMPSINVTVGGNYTVRVLDANGCEAMADTLITEPDALEANLSQVVNASCDDTTDGYINLMITGGTEPYSINWSTNDTTTLLYGLGVGSYGVTITDANGCEGQYAYAITAPSCNLPPIANDDSTGTTPGTTVDITILTNDYDPDGDNIHISTITRDPNHGTVTVNSDGSVTYMPNEGFTGVDSFIYVICDDGIPELCDEATVYIMIAEDKPYLFIPNGISPNGDESNETWEIIGIDKFPNNEVVIFNRWGNKIYSAKSYINQWRGTNQRGDPLPDGTYYFILHLNDEFNSTYTGYVIIHR